jgi:PAS domain S-box-containing protein
MQQPHRTIRATTAGLVLAAAVVALLVILSILTYRTQQEDSVVIRGARNLLFKLGTVRSMLAEAESSQRGYIITGKTSYLIPYNDARTRIDAELRNLQQLTRSRAAEQLRVERLRKIVEKKFDELEETLSMYDQQGPAAALTLVSSDQGQQLMDEARTLMDEIRQRETDNLQARSTRATRLRQMASGLTIGGGIVLFIVICGNTLVIRRDLREREQIEEALRQSEERLSTTLSSIGDAVLATDEKGNVTFMNAVAEQVSGWKQAEAIGRDAREVFRILNESDRQPASSPIEAVITGGKILSLAGQTLLVRKDGSEVYVDDSGAPIRDRAGKLIGAILVFRDTTAKRRQEQELLSAHSTVMDLNERLKRSMTETHHRVKNSLQLMTALIDLQAAEFSDEFSGRMNQLKGQLRSLSTVHDVLTAQSMETGDAQTISTGRLLEKLLSTTARIAAPRKLSYDIQDVRITGKLGTSLALATNELVLNALKHGTGAISVVFRVEGPTALLEVQDEGPGIPADFDPASVASTGLTLIESLAKWDLKGRISYANRADGRGAAVSITFPVEG